MFFHPSRWLLVALLLICSFLGRAQSENVWITDGDTLIVGDVDSSRMIIEVRDHLLTMIARGHLYAGLDSVRVTENQRHWFLHYGPKLSWSVDRIRVDTITREELARRPENLKEVLLPLVNSGHPFASLTIDVKQVIEGQALVDVEVKKNVYVTFDSLSLTGDVNAVRPSYLWDVLNFRPGNPYSEHLFQSIGDKIRRSPVVGLGSDPDVSFSNERATVYLEIEERSDSQFDGIVGIQPDQEGGTVLTGYFNLTLGNLFRSGRRLDLRWQRFQAASQRLDAAFTYPYILHSRLHLSGGIDILKQDSSFLNRTISLGIAKDLGRSATLGFHFSNYETNLLDGRKEPGVLPFRTNWYGASLAAGDAGTQSGRSSFVWSDLSAEIGNKQVTDELAVDTTGTDLLNWRMEGVLGAQRPVLRRALIQGKLVARHVDNEALSLNELFRVGGLRSFRGFNENELFLQTLFQGTIEYRHYFEARSYLIAFGEGGYAGNSLAANAERFLGSFGAGLALNTSNGVFNFIFALGFTNDRRPTLAETKIHFGYTSYF